MFKKISLRKLISFCLFSTVFLCSQSYAKTYVGFNPQIIGKPSVMYEKWKLKVDSYTLTADGKKLYVLKQGKLFIFQMKPFKRLAAIDFPFKKTVKEYRYFYRIWVTSDERLLNLVLRDKVIQYDLQAKKITQTLLLENQKLVKSTFYNDELLLFCFDRTTKHASLGPGYSGPNPHTIKVFDAHTLKFKKDLNYLLGREYINSNADSIHQIDDKFFWHQPYGFGVYAQNTAWQRVIDSNTYSEELAIFSEANNAFLSITTHRLILPYVTEVRDFFPEEDHKPYKIMQFATKPISFDLKTRQFLPLAENFFKNIDAFSLKKHSFEKGYLLLNTPTVYLKNKDSIIGTASGFALGLYNVRTAKFTKLFLDAEGESILIDPKTGEFVATPGARKYLYFKQAEDQYLPISDEQYLQYSKTQIN